MMNYGFGGMMGFGGSSFGLLGLLAWLVWTGVGVLLLVLLWQKVTRK